MACVDLIIVIILLLNNIKEAFFKLILSDERWGRGLKCRDLGFFNHKVKQMNNKNHPKGEKKQAERRLEHSQT